jgi:putative membrane protein
LIPLSYLPTVNAGLNAASALLLVCGYLHIRRGRIVAHQLCMLSAFSTSALFLISYLTYHYYVGSVPFQGEGWSRIVYFSVLISHAILAVAIVPMALVTLGRALKGNFARHKRIAQWTLPLWLYVSVTGVMVYGMLYWP